MGATCCGTQVNKILEGEFNINPSCQATPRPSTRISIYHGKDPGIVRMQALCRGYLARKDVHAFKDADITENDSYFNAVVDDIASKLGRFEDSDPLAEKILRQGQKRYTKTKTLIREAGHEIGIYAGDWVRNLGDEKTDLPRREIRHGRGTFIAWPTGAFYEG